MDMAAAHPLQPAPIVAHAATTMIASAPTLSAPISAQSPAMARPITMTAPSIGATALQAQPARATMVKDEMAHLQRAAAASRAAERPVEEHRSFAAPQGTPEARRSTLFEKMTSRLTGAPAGRAAAPAQQAQAPRMPARETQRAEPRMEQPAPQPMLNLDPADRISSPRAEEDLLDIPAFLRRQAN
jgi:cell division protein FtsZ